MSNVEPWLSVIMPSYCGERWIGAALDSLVAERAASGIEGIEVLVIDGSPSCETLDIAAQFTDRLPLRLFARPDLESWHTKTNFGVESAAAAHLCWLGVDDLWLPGRSAAARRWIETAPQAALHLAPSAIIDRSGRTLGIWRCPLSANREIPSGRLLERLLVQNFIAAPAPIFRKDAWIRCGGLDPALWYTADWDLWLKLAAAGAVYYHDEVTIGFRIHSGSLTTTGSRNAADYAEQMQIVFERHLQTLGRNSDSVGGTSDAIERAARASIQVNTALAAAAQGDYKSLPAAGLAVLRLGPAGLHRYFRDSRITERLLPRIRAKLSGGL